MTQTRIACALAAALAAALTGCSDTMRLDTKMEGRMNGELALRIDGPLQIQMQGPTIRYEGTYISDELLDQVKADKTTDDWVLAVLGEPTSRNGLRDGTEIWKWVYRPVAQEASVIEVFSSSDKEPKLATRMVFVQIRDGVVIGKWKG